MFSSPEKSFDLPVYADAMARASLPTRPSCVPRKHNVDPRVVEYFDIDATVDASFLVDCSDPESSSLSGADIDATIDASFLVDCSDPESSSLSGADIDATVDASFPIDCSNFESSSLSGAIFQRRFSKSMPCSDDSTSESS
jgi:hypothetical protein